MSTSFPTLRQSQQQIFADEPNEQLPKSQSYQMSGLPLQGQSNFEFLQKKLELAPQRIKEAVLLAPAIMHGNPVFSGTRIPLYQIVEELADGTPFEELTEGYPSLDLEKIRSGLDFVSSLLRIYDADEDVSH